jgi:hypothetical protein
MVHYCRMNSTGMPNRMSEARQVERYDALEIRTHEMYLCAVRDEIVGTARLNAEERRKLLETELLYGAGKPFVYGTCFFGRWTREGTHDIIEISAFSEESVEQLWETVAHEYAHVLAGFQAGHGLEWKAAAKRLGLRRPTAVGPAGGEDLDPELARRLRGIPLPQDGNPLNYKSASSGDTDHPDRGCPLGIGTRGGVSRGPGSGRLRLYLCECTPRPVRVRVASKEFRARCLTCNAEFRRAEPVRQPA